MASNFDQQRESDRQFELAMAEHRALADQSQHYWRLLATSFSLLFGWTPLAIIIGRDSVDVSTLIKACGAILVLWIVMILLPMIAALYGLERSRSYILSSVRMGWLPRNRSSAIAGAAAVLAGLLLGIVMFYSDYPQRVFRDRHQRDEQIAELLKRIDDLQTELTNDLKQAADARRQDQEILQAKIESLLKADQASPPPVLPGDTLTAGPPKSAVDRFAVVVDLAKTLYGLADKGTDKAMGWSKYLASLGKKSLGEFAGGFSHKAGEELAATLFGSDDDKKRGGSDQSLESHVQVLLIGSPAPASPLPPPQDKVLTSATTPTPRATSGARGARAAPCP